MIRVGVIGAGIFVRETYIPNINANSDKVKLTALLCRSPTSIDEALVLLQQGREDVHCFVGADGEEAFFAQARELCDAVLVVVPIPALGKMVSRCLHAGLNVLSEKPVAMTSGEARELIATYHELKANGALWHVAENYRLEPSVMYARDLVRVHPTPPKTFSLTALRQQSATSKFAVTQWRATPEYRGSFVLDGGIHFVALLRTVLGGEVSKIHSTYEEKSVVEVGACGTCRVGTALGTFQIRYGAFHSVVCRLDVYWDDAIMNIIQHKGTGYEVIMTGHETKFFPFQGLEKEFQVWLDSVVNRTPVSELLPEEGLTDLLIVEEMCCSPLA